MKCFVMGMETEYSVSGRRGARRIPPEMIFRLLCDELRKELPCLPDHVGHGMYTSQGSRFYLDHGAHPEWSSPELSTPAQVAAYDVASERLLCQARDRLRQRDPTLRISIIKNNLCPISPDATTYGSHESYTCWGQRHRLGDVADQLIPHIISRIVFAGSGCFSTHPDGVGFELSQRARHLVHAIGEETTHDRAIFSTRIKSTDVSSDGWIRIHLIAADSHRGASLGTYLTFGTTGLLVLLINAGRRVGAGLQLADPVQSMRRLSLDPSLLARVSLDDGRKLTALEIQECYLADCERNLQRGEFPDWTSDVVRTWRATIERLASDPLKLAGSLDIYRKLLIYQHALDREGVTWAQFRETATVLDRFRQSYPVQVVQAVLSGNARSLPSEGLSTYREARRSVRGRLLKQLRFVVRMQSLEMNYHELGGTCDPFVACEQIAGGVIRQSDVDQAMQEPPQNGRAAARGGFIAAHHHEDDWSCTWQYILNSKTGIAKDLGDPFEHRTPRTVSDPLEDSIPQRSRIHVLLADLLR